jgi:hypothetical protein
MDRLVLADVRQRIPTLVLCLSLLLAIGGAWLVRTAPRDPAWAGGLLRLDGLSACFAALTLALALSHPAPLRQRLLVPLLLCAAYQTTHLALLGAALFAAAILFAPRRWEAWIYGLLAWSGPLFIAIQAGSWRYPTPGTGLGLNSFSFSALLAATLLAAGALAFIRGKQPAAMPIIAAASIYTLYRLFSLGPWNLGWQLAAILIGTASVAAAALHIAFRPNTERLGWLATLQIGSAIIGGGLASSAGLAMGGAALLSLAIQQVSLTQTHHPALRWLTAGAIPLSFPFIAGWLSIAAASASGSSILASVIWASMLLAAVGVVQGGGRGTGELENQGTKSEEHRAESTERSDRTRELGNQGTKSEEHRAESTERSDRTRELGNQGTKSEEHRAESTERRAVTASPGHLIIWSLLHPAGLLVLPILLQPMIAQLQGGLTPFGEVIIWPWAGFLALNAARQPVATQPTIIIAALMLILATLVWVISELLQIYRARRTGAA